jgi:hypothetical protein
MRKTTLYTLICTLSILTLLGTGSTFAEVMIKGGIDVSGTRDVEGVKNDVEQSYSAPFDQRRHGEVLFHPRLRGRPDPDSALHIHPVRHGAGGSYSIYNGVHEFGGSTFDTTYSTFSLKAGLKF